MMTRDEIAAIDRECEQQHISQHEYLDSHGIARHQYYRWKRRYREEDEQSLVPAGFVPMMPCSSPIQPIPAPKPKGKQQKPQDQESFLTVEIRTSCGSSVDIYNLIPGKTYSYKTSNNQTGTFSTTGRRRMIKVSGTKSDSQARNCRFFTMSLEYDSTRIFAVNLKQKPQAR